MASIIEFINKTLIEGSSFDNLRVRRRYETDQYKVITMTIAPNTSASFIPDAEFGSGSLPRAILLKTERALRIDWGNNDDTPLTLGPGGVFCFMEATGFPLNTTLNNDDATNPCNVEVLVVT